jgi:hypothetical protein
MCRNPRACGIPSSFLAVTGGNFRSIWRRRGSWAGPWLAREQAPLMRALCGAPRSSRWGRPPNPPLRAPPGSRGSEVGPRPAGGRVGPCPPTGASVWSPALRAGPPVLLLKARLPVLRCARSRWSSAVSARAGCPRRRGPPRRRRAPVGVQSGLSSGVHCGLGGRVAALCQCIRLNRYGYSHKISKAGSSESAGPSPSCQTASHGDLSSALATEYPGLLSDLRRPLAASAPGLIYVIASDTTRSTKQWQLEATFNARRASATRRVCH